MSKNKFLKDLSSFGEGFVKTLQSERERKQKELEFNQEMSYKTRQQNLMSTYYQAQIKNMEFDNQLAKVKEETDIRGGYDESVEGKSGAELNKPYGGLLSPFQEDKSYAPKQGEMKVDGIERTITDYTNPNDPRIFGVKDSGEKIDLGRGKVDKVSGSGSGSNKPSKPVKLGNKYEIEAFNRLKNPGLVEKDMFGNEIYANTPEQKDADFNTMANALLTPSALEQIYKLRKKGGYPSVDELVKSLDNPNLSDEDEQSIEDFIKYYSQIESTLAPTKVQWWK